MKTEWNLTRYESSKYYNHHTLTWFIQNYIYSLNYIKFLQIAFLFYLIDLVRKKCGFDCFM